MVFSSLLFLFYFLPAVLLCNALAKGVKIKNLVLFLFSLLFYAWGEPLYIFLMLFTIAFGYLTGLLLKRFDSSEGVRKLVLVLSCVVNLGILGVFKYTDFFIENLNGLLGLSIPAVGLALPIGISFYTFQTMSYTIDVYRRNAPIQTNIISFGTYVALFPQLIAGPIVRYNTIAQQLTERSENADRFVSGLMRFITGLGKKVLLANQAGYLWDQFKVLSGAQLSVAGAWLGAVCFTFQIYFDFSGYSDMAIGLGRMFGFEFLENFNYPYISKSITEFWRRWHISLSTWFKEYVYIPLGGNRVKLPRMYWNIFVVWLLTGLWHGASWNYVLWGLYYCLLLIIEKTVLKKPLEKLPEWIQHLYALLLIIIGWTIFGLEDIGMCTAYLAAMFGAAGGGAVDQTFLYYFVQNLPLLAVLCVASLPLCGKWFSKATEGRAYVLRPLLALLLFAVSVAYLVDSTYNPFLYFRF